MTEAPKLRGGVKDVVFENASSKTVESESPVTSTCSPADALSEDISYYNWENG